MVDKHVEMNFQMDSFLYNFQKKKVSYPLRCDDISKGKFFLTFRKDRDGFIFKDLAVRESVQNLNFMHIFLKVIGIKLSKIKSCTLIINSILSH